MWDKIQQLIRIVLYMVGGGFLGVGATEADTFTMGVGAVINAASFLWWLYWEVKRKIAEKKALEVAATTGSVAQAQAVA